MTRAFLVAASAAALAFSPTAAFASGPDEFWAKFAKENAVGAHAAVFGQSWRVTAANSKSGDDGRRSDSFFTFTAAKGDRVRLTVKSDRVGAAPLLALGNCYSLQGERAEASDFVPANSQDRANTAMASEVFTLPAAGEYVCTISQQTWASAGDKTVLVPPTPYSATLEKP
jgi:hypothetical protein